MRKVVTIESCEDCPYVWLYLGRDEHCLLMKRKPIPLDDDHPIPTWCPLIDAPDELIEIEEELKIDAGINFEGNINV